LEPPPEVDDLLFEELRLLVQVGYFAFVLPEPALLFGVSRHDDLQMVSSLPSSTIPWCYHVAESTGRRFPNRVTSFTRQCRGN